MLQYSFENIICLSCEVILTLELTYATESYYDAVCFQHSRKLHPAKQLGILVTNHFIQFMIIFAEETSPRCRRTHGFRAYIWLQDLIRL
jgi:hypothetical protein